MTSTTILLFITWFVVLIIFKDQNFRIKKLEEKVNDLQFKSDFLNEKHEEENA